MRKDVCLGVSILIETVEMSTTGSDNTAEYLTGVPATAEGDINIDPASADIQPVDALIKEYRHMICLSSSCHRKRLLLIFVIPHYLFERRPELIGRKEGLVGK